MKDSRYPPSPARPSSADLDPRLEILLGGDPDRRLVCRACRSPVTADGFRIDVEGGHVHRRINPAGVDYEFGCFEKAPGAARAGQATPEHSWFAGYVWRLSICSACGTQLGELSLLS